MKIALLAPIEERVPPKTYGGTEVVVHALAEAFHRLGHDVTLFASGDSKVSCRLVPLSPKAIGSSSSKRLRESRTYCAVADAVQHFDKEKFDIIHNHIGWQPLIFNYFIKSPLLTTIHFALDSPTEACMYERYKQLPFVSISNNQRKSAPSLNYVKTIYHGLDLAPFSFKQKAGDYLAFLGRFSPVKGPVEAIQIAKKTGLKLFMAGKVNDFERDFYDKEVAPYVDNKQIFNVGEVDLKAKVKLLSNALAFLSPIKWEEPFGLTNIEAMACGTPVVGMRRGSLPEIVKDGETGFLCKSTAEMVEAVKKVATISREVCRRSVEESFTAERMAKDYLQVYQKLRRA